MIILRWMSRVTREGNTRNEDIRGSIWEDIGEKDDRKRGERKYRRYIIESNMRCVEVSVKDREDQVMWSAGLRWLTTNSWGRRRRRITEDNNTLHITLYIKYNIWDYGQIILLKY